jgi:hypothetical protein
MTKPRPLAGAFLADPLTIVSNGVPHYSIQPPHEARWVVELAAFRQQRLLERAIIGASLNAG